MPDFQRIHPAIHAAATFAVVLGMIVVSRQQQSLPAARRAIPELVTRSKSTSLEPWPLEIMPAAPLARVAAGGAVPAGFPEEDQESQEPPTDEIGPIPDAEPSVYGASKPDAVRRLPSVAE